MTVKLAFVALAFILSCGTAYADPCDRDDERASPHKIQYKLAKRPPGKQLTIGDISYVMVRIPFTDFSNNDRYTITFPTLQYVRDTYEQTSANPFFNTSHRKGTPCSDISISGQQDVVHKIPIHESRHSSLQVLDYTKAGRDVTTTLTSTRSNRVELLAQIGGTAVSLLLFGPNKTEIDLSMNKADYNMSDDIDWSALDHSPTPEINQLNRLIDFVYITKLD